MEQTNTSNRNTKGKRNKVMEKVTDTITAGAGIGVIELVNHADNITQGGGLILQVIIGIITLIKMFKSKKDANNEKL